MRSLKFMENLVSVATKRHGLSLTAMILISLSLVVFAAFGVSALGVSYASGAKNVANLPIEVKNAWIPAERTKDSMSITLSIDGQSWVLQARGGTVGELLQQRKIAINAPDYTKPSKDTILSSGLVIKVVHVTTALITEESPIPFEIKHVDSEYVYKGREVVKQDGKDGLLKTTFKATYENGVETSRTPVEEVVAEDPVDQVIERGCGGTITTKDGETLHFVMKLNVKATAYTTDGYQYKITATGTLARVGAIAVDPDVIPYGTSLYITSKNGTSWVYGKATAEDTGGAIQGNRVDLFFNTRKECFDFGRKNAVVYILESE